MSDDGKCVWKVEGDTVDRQQLKDLASAAQSGIWPPHLLPSGVDKKVVLGEALEGLLDMGDNLEKLRSEIRGLETERDMLEGEVVDLKAQLKELIEAAPKQGLPLDVLSALSEG